MSSSPTYLDSIVIPLIKGESVLDVGCGFGRWGNLLYTNFWEARLAKPPIIDGIDAFGPNVELCRKHICYRNVLQKELPCELDGEWDTVLACEFIEHTRQEDCESIVEFLEAKAKHRIIFSTPNYKALRGGSDTIVGYNNYEAHQSHLPRKYFRRRGYRVVPIGFGNPNSIFVKLIALLGWKLFSKGIVTDVTICKYLNRLNGLCTVVPPWAHAYVAVKDKNG